MTFRNRHSREFFRFSKNCRPVLAPVDASSQLGLKRQFAQMRKDMRRDRVSLDGVLVTADDGEHHEAIASQLARRVLDTAHSFPRDPRNAEVLSLAEAGALEHACAVLVAFDQPRFNI